MRIKNCKINYVEFYISHFLTILATNNFLLMYLERHSERRKRYYSSDRCISPPMMYNATPSYSEKINKIIVFEQQFATKNALLEQH
jgi:hypothetical protein